MLNAKAPDGARVALVTGSGRGIGRGVALALARDGIDIVINDLPNRAEADAVKAEVEALGRRALVVRADVSDRAQVEAMVKTAVDHFGRLDILVANAARSIRRPFIELTWDEAWATFSVTLFGVWHTCQFGAQQMVRQGWGGKIIIIGSIQGELPVVGSTAYNTCKAGIIHFGVTLANEMAPHRINVNVINPGWIDTPGERAFFSEAEMQRGGERIPWGRLGTPDDIGRMAAYLASDQADYITGSVLKVDGGLSMWM